MWEIILLPINKWFEFASNRNLKYSNIYFSWISNMSISINYIYYVQFCNLSNLNNVMLCSIIFGTLNLKKNILNLYIKLVVKKLILFSDYFKQGLMSYIFISYILYNTIWIFSSIIKIFLITLKKTFMILYNAYF